MAHRGTRDRVPSAVVDLGLKGRTALVCGASSGLALASAEALAEEGANVTMFARRRDVLEREADRIGALAVRGDVTLPQDLERAVQQTISAFGGADVESRGVRRPVTGPSIGSSVADAATRRGTTPVEI